MTEKDNRFIKQDWEKRIMTYPGMTREEAEDCLKLAVSLVEKGLEKFTHDFPDCNTENGRYPVSENREWTTGFWTGQIWLAYEYAKDKQDKKAEIFKTAGEIQVESFLHRIEEKVDVNHHDMGFLYTPSCVAAYKLTGNETARKAALLAADNLMGRFQEKGGFFQAWGELGAKENYRLIIDCLLNMPLLFWASSVTGDESYQEKARIHIQTAMRHLIRPDHSTYHTYFFDPKDGSPVGGVTHQGNRDGSAWSRGQAWGIYGSAMAYRYVRDKEYIDIFRKVTDFFLENLPGNLIPYWDFDFKEGSGQSWDSSAAVIGVCGMLEMAKYLEKDEAEKYTAMAGRLLLAAAKECGVKSPADSDGLLLHGTYAHASPNNPCQNRGVDECNTWGDYYYMEALTRLVKDWELYW
ncbi:unsaturated chondroitin disaccharide hydrolase [Lachnospiraceae bacterium]|jgi:unsaturated chondroitin disaccharide hydrolase|nr:unsaturated chondroitin disaccharide hydrolase [Lachnospiraceae bacterium]